MRLFTWVAAFPEGLIFVEVLVGALVEEGLIPRYINNTRKAVKTIKRVPTAVPTPIPAAAAKLTANDFVAEVELVERGMEDGIDVLVVVKVVEVGRAVGTTVVYCAVC